MEKDSCFVETIQTITFDNASLYMILRTIAADNKLIVHHVFWAYRWLRSIAVWIRFFHIREME